MSHGLTGLGLVSETQPAEKTVWQRPADWLALPAVLPGDQKIVGLYKIVNGDNWFAFSATGAYTIDWGDGTTTNTASGTVTYKNLSWAAYAGSDTSDGFRQAVITITPQGGSTLTSASFNVKHNQAGLPAYITGWLDIKMSGPSVATMNVGTGGGVSNGALKQFEYVGSSALTTAFNLFNPCSQLAVVKGSSFLSACADLTSCFQSCSMLTSLPADLNTSAATNASSMFYNCYSLATVPLMNIASVTAASSMFYGCSSLVTIPLMNFGSCVTFQGMFSACSSLQSVPLINTAAGTNLSSMFINCFSLTTIPLFNTAACTTFASMFANCGSLSVVPLLDTSAGTNFAGMFSNCYALRSVSAFNVTNGTAFSTMFSNCPSLQSAPLVGGRYSISYASCSLGPSALDAIYTNLGTAAGAQTITVTSNYGTTGDTPSIATAKGWTVTGS